MAKKDEQEQVDPTTGEVTISNASGALVAGDFEYGDDMGAGFEGQTSDDVSVPFLEILQPNSPECAAEGGPRPGMIINRTTGEVWSGKEGINFVPCKTRHQMIEWRPRDAGGGIVATHEMTSEIAERVRKEQPLGKYKVDPNDDKSNDLIETFYVFGVHVREDGGLTPSIIAFSSTKIKPYRDWMARARSIVLAIPDVEGQPKGRKATKFPLFGFGYNLQSVYVEKNNYKWYTWVVKFAGENAEASRLPPSGEVYQLAKGVYEAAVAGTVKADEKTLQNGDGEAAPQKAGTDAKDAPY